jgi:aspartate aminotransferase-like enzyme
MKFSLRMSNLKKLVMVPGPTNVPERVLNAMLGSIINHRSEEFTNLYRSIQSGCQYAFQTRNDVVVLSASGTGGVDAAVGSILSPGDSVVIPSFGEFSSRLGDSARYVGANVVAPECELGKVPDIEAIDQAMRTAGSPKALFVVYNETSTGATWRHLRELKAIASKYGALFVVDAISVLGGDQLPVDELGVDICIAGTQKCLAAPPGGVILSFSSEAKRAMSTVKPRTQSFDIPRYFKFAEHGETPFTPSLPIFFALDEALRIIREEGIENRIKRHAVSARAFYAAFEAIGLTPFADPSCRSHTVIGILYPPGIDDAKFRALLSRRFGILIAGGFGKMKGKMFRVGSMGMVNEEIVTLTVGGIAHAMNYLGYECEASKALSAAWNEFSKPTEHKD